MNWIYFFWVEELSQIKIGRTTGPRGKRQKQLETDQFGKKYTLQLLCEVKGSANCERELHRYFASERVSPTSEMFEPSERLVDFIRWLRDQWFVADKEMSDLERDNLAMVDFGNWAPDERRRKSASTAILPGFHGPLDLGERVVTGDDFYTNEIIIEAARRVLGRIDLDPASHPIANEKVKAEQFFTVHDDGVTKQWHGRVWLNPPFSEWSRWVPKILSEFSSGRVEALCVLSAMRTVTAKYFAPLLESCQCLCIIHGRIKFWGGKAGDSPDDGHCIFYFGEDTEQFQKEFSELGTCFETSRQRCGARCERRLEAV